MKKTLLILGIFVSVVEILPTASAASFPKNRCSQEFNDPKITYKNFGTFYICTSVPAAYITYEQAKYAALKMNLETARANCGAMIHELSRPQILIRNHVATVISLFSCY